MTAENSTNAFIGVSSPDGNLTVECAPQAGGSITAFRAGKADVFRPYDSALPLHPLNTASFPLTPYSNRIIDCRLQFEGDAFDVGPRWADEPHQLHGDGWLSPWQVREQTAHSVTLSLTTRKRPETPYVYEAVQTYRLDNAGLAIDMSVTNLSGRRLPFGLGHHPYFIRSDETVLRARLPTVWHSQNIVPRYSAPVPDQWDFSNGIKMSDAHFMPPRQGVRGDDLLDHCFAGWDQKAEIFWPDRDLKLLITADPVFNTFVIYIPCGKPFFCAEPVTHVNDAFNLMGRGVGDVRAAILDEGETLQGTMNFKVGRFSPVRLASA